VDNNIEKELKHLGQIIRDFRLSKNMTQSSLASSCDIDVRTIQMIEKGTLNMSLKIFFAIAKTFEMNPSEFLLSIEASI
jgi:transcriptional regulator with XRE-family HTH domain